MTGTSTELKVGLFAIIVIVFLTYMTFKVGSLPMLWEEGYRLSVMFDDISGLDEQSRIKVAGVDAGIVEKITLIDGQARLTLLINPEIKVYENSKVLLRMTGLLGDRHLALSTGSSDKRQLQDGDEIMHAVPAVDIGMLASNLTAAAVYLKDLTSNINSILGESQRADIKESIHNLQVITSNLREISVENKEPLGKVIAQLENFTKSLSEEGPGFMKDMRNVARTLDEKGPELIDNLNVAVREIKAIVGENREAINESMANIRDVSSSASNIARKLEDGEGTLGRLMQDDSLYNSLTNVAKQAEKSFDFAGRLKTYLDFHGEYNTGESEWKGYFNLTLRPQEDKYYILGIVTDPRGSVKTTERTINGITTIEEEVESKIEFTAQFAKKFGDMAMRIGLMENTFGIGADYFFNSEKGRIKVDVWDFGSKEAESHDPHARIGADYTVFKFIFISAGVDNLLNSNRRGIFVGGGVKFEDEDLKYLMGSAPNVSLK